MDFVNKRLLITLITLGVIAIGAIVAVFLVKGYTFSTKEGGIVGTGIISLTSSPSGAAVYIDGHLTTATDTTLSSLPPKEYTVRIAKDGFIPWEKQIDVKEGLVTEVKATLFPAIPSIYPLTYNGVVSPILSPDGQKLAFAVPEASDSADQKNSGLWVWNLASQPIAFNRAAEPHQIVVSTPDLNFSTATLRWSPDSKQLLATLQAGGQPGDANLRNYSLGVDQVTSSSDLRDITPILGATLKTWDDDQAAQDAARVADIKDLSIRQIASSSAVLKWSPDETKIITAKSKPVKEGEALSGYKVYDLETHKNYDLPGAKAYYWLPDSEHVILVQDGKIALCDFDGSNVAVVYAGNFDDSLVFAWPDSSRLVMVSSFPTPTANQPNLFGINLK